MITLNFIVSSRQRSIIIFCEELSPVWVLCSEKERLDPYPIRIQMLRAGRG